MATHPRTHDAYTIGWICALSKEQTAATAMLDERHQDLPKPTNDPNTYTFGSIDGHNIVIACLPEGKIGTNPAAVVASHMVHAFPTIRFGLMVGIGGGIPSKVRLGDVVVSVPGDQHPGVVQWDMGKAEQGGKFRRTGALNNPPTSLRTALTKLKTDHELEGSKISQYLEELQIRYPRLAKKYLRSDSLQDVLFKASYGHVEKQHSDASEEELDASEDDAEEDCRDCDKTQIIKRKPRDMRVHYGLIASGNQVVKDAAVRDQLLKDMDKKVLCVEMEAAGLMDNFPCIVIRGICDYADSHKNKAWQEHAAAVAAAFAKELLGYIQPQEVDQEKTVKDALAQVNKKLVTISSGVDNVQSKVDSIYTGKHHDDIMRWLGPPDVSNNLNKALKTRHPGSGQRLIQGEPYQKWKSQPTSFLWLHGIPGCGKTILTSTVMEDLQNSQSQGLLPTLLYFYFDFTDSSKQSFENTLRSLIWQMHHQNENARKHLDSLYSSACRDGKKQPSFESLQRAFTEMIANLEEVWIVLDALDECTPRGDLLAWLRSLNQDLSVKVILHILVTSRPEQDIESAIKRYASDEQIIAVRDDLLEADIRNYVQAQVREHEGLSRWRGHKEIQDKIEASLLEKANGMFRWVSCQLDALEDCLERKALLKALQSLPQTLDETYERILANIPSAYIHHTRRILQFLTYSERPLRLKEAVDAIAVDIGQDVARGRRFDPKDRLPVPEEITRYCSSLVILISRQGVYGEEQEVTEIQLAHFSVKDYLTSNRLASTTALYFQEVFAQSSIAEVCLAYLLELEHNKAAKKIKKDFYFAMYSAQYWASHAVIGERSEKVIQLAKELLSSRALLESWVQLYNPVNPWQKVVPRKETLSALYYASFIGLTRCVEMLLENGADVNAQGGKYSNALQVASYKGHKETTRLLLDKGAAVNAQGGKYGNALEAASYKGHQEIVQLLLDNGADVITQGGWYGNALQAASSGGHREIVQLLLDNGADVNTQGGCYSNALEAASSGGHRDIVQILLDNGADVNTRCGIYSNALHAASAEGCRDTVQILLDNGADVNAKWYGNALEAASSAGNLDVVQILLDNGADVNAQAGFHGNALYAALSGGHQDIVQILVDNGADINIQSESFGNALESALFRVNVDIVHLDIMQILVDNGADVNTRGGWYGNALEAASFAGNLDIVQSFIDKGADVNAQGGAYGNALCAALSEGHWDIVRILIDNGADVNTQGGEYGDALQVASYKGYKGIIRLLLDKGAAVNAQGGAYGNALCAALYEGHWDIVRILIDEGADVNAQGGKYGDALVVAVNKGHEEIVQLLLDNGADWQHSLRSFI